MKYFWKNIVVVVLLGILYGCSEEHTSDNYSPILPLPQKVTLYVSYDDANRVCIRALNANNLVVQDSLTVGEGVPWDVVFVENGVEWYSVWGRGVNYSLYCGSISPLNVKKSIPIRYSNSSLITTSNQKYIITFNTKGVEVFDRSDLSPILVDTTLSSFPVDLYPSNNQNKFYFTKSNKDQFIGFGIYDLDSMNVVGTIPVFDKPLYDNLQVVDFIVSKDDKTIYLSAWTWTGATSGYGSLFEIDINEKKVLNEHKVGAFSQLSMSPDGESIYISDPGGYLYMLPMTGIIWKYNTLTRNLAILTDQLYGADKIAVADDNRTIFVSSWGEFIFDNGVRANIVKLDGISGNILTHYSIPRDTLGNVSSLIRSITLGK